MLEELLRLIYPKHDISALIDRVEKLKTEYASKISKERFSLTERDVVLITYGDQLNGEEQNRLTTLHSFLDKYIKHCINSIHLLPFYPYTSDDGFSVVNYTQVNPDIGTWNDIQNMAKDYHLMFDAVINHMSQKSDWFQGYLNDQPDFKQYFIDADPSDDWSKVIRPRTSPLLHAFSSKSKQTKNIWTTFSQDQVDLNYSNPDVLISILAVLLEYIDKGAILLRLDAIGFLFKKPGTTCIHLEETHAIIKVIRLVIKDLAPQVVLVSETNVPHKENMSYFGNGTDEAHMVYNFTLPPLLAYSILKGSTQTFSKWTKSLSLPSEETCFINFTASHDGIGVRPLTGILPEEEGKLLIEAAVANGGLISYRSMPNGNKSPYEINCNYLSLLFGKEKSEKLAIKRMILAQAVMLSFPGVPSFYFHSLFGSTNDIEGVSKTGMNRSINREKLDVDTLENELDEENGLRATIFNELKNMIQCRIMQKAFSPTASFKVLDMEEGLFVLQRTAALNEQKILCIYNFTSEERKITFPDGAFNELLSNEIVSGEIELNSYEFKWLVYS